MKNSKSKILEFKSTRDPVKILGTFILYDHVKNAEENFLTKIRKMKTKLNSWLSRDLTLYGRSSLAKAINL